MGIFIYEVYFADTLPSMESVCKEVKKITGWEELECSITIESAEFMNPLNGKYIQVYYTDRDSHIVEVEVIGKMEKNYLAGVTIAALVALGGKYDSGLPKWTQLKRKDLRWWHFAPS